MTSTALRLLWSLPVLGGSQEVTPGTSPCPQPSFFNPSGEVGGTVGEVRSPAKTRASGGDTPREQVVILNSTSTSPIQRYSTHTIWVFNFFLSQNKSWTFFHFPFLQHCRNAGGHRDQVQGLLIPIQKLPKAFRSETLFPRIISVGSQAI